MAKQLPKWLTTVTPFSKLLALTLFITLPLFTFFLGLRFNSSADDLLYKNPLQKVQVTTVLTPLETPPSIKVTTAAPTTTPLSLDTCLEGAQIHHNVKNCSENLSCDPYTPFPDRFCRLPDGSCKFFCTDK